MCAKMLRMAESHSLSGKIPRGEKSKGPYKSESLGLESLSIYLSMYLFFSDLSSKTMSRANNQMSPPFRSVMLWTLPGVFPIWNISNLNQVDLWWQQPYLANLKLIYQLNLSLLWMIQTLGITAAAVSSPLARALFPSASTAGGATWWNLVHWQGCYLYHVKIIFFAMSTI